MGSEVSQGQGFQCVAMQGDVDKVTFRVAAIQDWRQLSAPCSQPSSPLLGQVSLRPRLLVVSLPSRAGGTLADGDGDKPPGPGIQGLRLASASSCFSEGSRCVCVGGVSALPSSPPAQSISVSSPCLSFTMGAEVSPLWVFPD